MSISTVRLSTELKRLVIGSTLLATSLAVTPVLAGMECGCLEEYTDKSAHLVTEEVMTALAERYGDGSGSYRALFDPEQDYGGPYAFSVALGRVEEDANGVTFAHTVQLTLALRHLRSRDQIESNAQIMNALDLEPGDAVLEEAARAPMGSLGEPYDYREVDDLGDLAILHVSPDKELFVVCGDALMEIVVSRSDLGDNLPEDAPAGMTADKVDIMIDLAEHLMTAC